jgi:Rps23 Pro-64 3,4-dihydroxylase Tpa1-like proline 4-hydroxylase
MTIEQAKDKLKKEGYTYFQLSEFDSEFYNWLSAFKNIKQNQLKERFTFLRADVREKSGKSYIGLNTDFGSFDKAKEKKDEIFSLVNSDMGFYINQIWHFTDTNVFLEIAKLDIKTYKNYVKKIIKHFFDIDESQEYDFTNMSTLYDDKCLLTNHSDGIQKNRICAILIYLNENYDEKDGGCLVLNNTEKVIPEFGNIAIIDLQSFDVPHMVTEVIGGPGRYTILSFINKK